jgi:hypothetical protein
MLVYLNDAPNKFAEAPTAAPLNADVCAMAVADAKNAHPSNADLPINVMIKLQVKKSYFE